MTTNKTKKIHSKERFKARMKTADGEDDYSKMSTEAAWKSKC